MTEFRTISDALDALPENHVTAVQLVKAAFARADAPGPELGIYLARFEEQALKAAEAADRLYSAGAPTGPLAGIPPGIKDVISTIDGTTTAQSLVLDPEWGERAGDAVAVRRLREAGGVITGKLTEIGSVPLRVPRIVPRTSH